MKLVMHRDGGVVFGVVKDYLTVPLWLGGIPPAVPNRRPSSPIHPCHYEQRVQMCKNKSNKIQKNVSSILFINPFC